ncbi:hypothetical protein [Streptomyces sp. BPTC-684]|uniref:LexA family protein n=1 Tax=Streptomyces sp. BPTC-684 TaxID=3043734 RepID=UPI0024B08765|nr:hypothetical protein [Streptomyces sp. BPTC-684]WHM41108.1 hypothetical protein QIY60_32460 [Streptomyces sp. BPTC-684]
MSGHLTERQLRIIRSAREWVAEHGEAPSVRELAQAAGLSSPSSIAYQLKRIRERGVVVETRAAPAACAHTAGTEHQMRRGPHPDGLRVGP